MSLGFWPCCGKLGTGHYLSWESCQTLLVGGPTHTQLISIKYDDLKSVLGIFAYKSTPVGRDFRHVKQLPREFRNLKSHLIANLFEKRDGIHADDLWETGLQDHNKEEGPIQTSQEMFSSNRRTETLLVM